MLTIVCFSQGHFANPPESQLEQCPMEGTNWTVGSCICSHWLCGPLVCYWPLCGHHGCSMGVPRGGFCHLTPHPPLPIPPDPTPPHPALPPIPPTPSIINTDGRKGRQKYTLKFSHQRQRLAIIKTDR